MLTANGSYVKVYIYLSKCIQTGENNLSISSLADKMDNTEKDILRALNYWEKNNLLHLIKNENNNKSWKYGQNTRYWDIIKTFKKNSKT